MVFSYMLISCLFFSTNFIFSSMETMLSQHQLCVSTKIERTQYFMLFPLVFLEDWPVPDID
jgi:hypothetical protein